MADVFTTDKRSAVMARIRSRGNRDTELRMILLFRLYGLTGWRRHLDLPGRPDFAFRRQRLAIFIDGCFWHGCPQHFRMPKSRRDYWSAKIASNRLRDRRVTRELRRRGWAVIRLWEHDITNKASLRTMTKLRDRIHACRANSKTIEI